MIAILPKIVRPAFYRTAAGAEIDLVLELPNQQIIAIEIKRSSAPKLERGFYNACEDIQPNKTFCIYNGEETFPLPNGVTAISLPQMMKLLMEEVS